MHSTQLQTPGMICASNNHPNRALDVAIIAYVVFIVAEHTTAVTDVDFYVRGLQHCVLASPVEHIGARC